MNDSMNKSIALPIVAKYIALPSWLQRLDGPMTRQLLLKPGQHGLGLTHQSLQADSTTTAVCGYCSTGCGMRVHLKDNEAIGLTPQNDYPVNLGMACPKGWEAIRVLDSPDRAVVPLLRSAAGQLQPVSWDKALTTFVDRLKSIINKHGPESVAFLSTGQIPLEEMALLGMLFKFGMGLVHGDANTRQCMATSVVAYKESLGFDAPPFCYEDFEQSDCLVFVGANPCIAHPILWERVLMNRNNPKIIVIDPRRTETAMSASQHLQIAPKGDLALLYAITQQLIEHDWIDKPFINRHTRGYEQLAQHVQRFTPDAVATSIGLSAEAIGLAARTIGQSKRVSLWWTMGINQSYEGVRAAQAIINIALITGNMGKPGTGANSITGQCNAMGSRLWSNTTNLIGHHRLDNPEDRAKVARILKIDESQIPTKPSLTYDQIIQRIKDRKIRALWVIATNPAHSWIDQSDCLKALKSLDFLCVQDMYHNVETANYAHLILPAAGWGEKEGTFINSERRYGLLKKVRRAPGEALSDFSIFKAIAHYWGVGAMFDRWKDPEDLFCTLQALSEGQPCDITGIDGYEQIDRCGGIQWPWTKADAALHGQPATHRRLFFDGKFFHDDGRARLIVTSPQAMPELPDQHFPFVLLTGRGTASQWHTQSRTSKSPILRKLYPTQPYVEINRSDADRLSIKNGQRVQVSSRRGSLQAVAILVSTVSEGQLFMPMHYGDVNKLTLASFDPYSRQPSYKNCAVAIQTVPLSPSR